MRLNDGSDFRANARLINTAICNGQRSNKRASDGKREIRQGRRIYDDIPQPYCWNGGVGDNVMRRGERGGLLIKSFSK
jgi:hypothetical protein